MPWLLPLFPGDDAHTFGETRGRPACECDLSQLCFGVFSRRKASYTITAVGHVGQVPTTTATVGDPPDLRRIEFLLGVHSFEDAFAVYETEEWELSKPVSTVRPVTLP